MPIRHRKIAWLLAGVVLFALGLVIGGWQVLHGRSAQRWRSTPTDPPPEALSDVSATGKTGESLYDGQSQDGRSDQLSVVLAHRANVPCPLGVHLHLVADATGPIPIKRLASAEAAVDQETVGLRRPDAHEGQLMLVVQGQRSGAPFAVKRLDTPLPEQITIELEPTSEVSVHVEPLPGGDVRQVRGNLVLRASGRTPPESYLIRRDKLELTQEGVQVVNSLPPGRFAASVLREAGLPFESKSLEVSGSSARIVFAAERFQSLDVQLVAKDPQPIYMVMVSSIPSRHLLDLMYERPFEVRGDAHSAVVRPGETVRFGRLRGRDYRVSVVNVEVGHERTLWWRDRVGAGTRVVADVDRHMATKQARHQVRLLGPDGEPFQDDWAGRVYYDIQVENHWIERSVPAGPELRLPGVHGACRLVFVPDKSTARTVAVSTAVFPMSTAQQQYEFRLFHARAVPSDTPLGEELLIEQPEGLPRARLDREQATSLVVEQDSGLEWGGIPVDQAAYVVSEGEVRALRGQVARVVLSNSANLTRYVVYRRFVGGYHGPLIVRARQTRTISLIPGRYEFFEALPTFRSEKLSWHDPARELGEMIEVDGGGVAEIEID